MAKGSVEDKLGKTRRKHEDLIDTVIATLYARGARGYSVTEQALNTDVVDLIKGEIAKADKREQKELKSEAEYRLERFKEFLDESDDLKERVQKKARSKDIPLEEAFDEVSPP